MSELGTTTNSSDGTMVRSWTAYRVLSPIVASSKMFVPVYDRFGIAVEPVV